MSVLNGDVPDSQLDYHLKGLIDEVQAVKLGHGRAVKESTDLKSQLERLDRAYESLRLENQVLKDRSKANQRVQETIESTERRVVCLIDGDEAIFSRSLVTRGRAGGLDAARMLVDGLKQFTKATNPEVPSYSLWIYCFLNRRGLVGPLDMPEATLDDFISGFNQAGGEFTFLIDIGPGKDAADARIKDLLNNSVHSPQTLKVYCGVGHDGGYVPALDSAITYGYKSKLVLLTGYKAILFNVKRLNLPTLEIPGLFEKSKLSSSAPGTPMSAVKTLPLLDSPRLSPRKSASSPSVIVESDAESQGDADDWGTYDGPKTGFAQPSTGSEPASEPASKPTSRSASKPKPSNPLYFKPGVPPFAHRPAPCNAYYVVGHCPHGENCDYSHDYVLRDGELEFYRECLQKVMCRSVEKGVPCTNPSCMYGHEGQCKFGAKCKYYRHGSCRYGGAEAHGEA